MNKLIFSGICLLLLTLSAACQTAAPSAPGGYFKAQDLPRTLTLAAGELQANTDIGPMLSALITEQQRVRVDFSPPVYPRGLSFSLEQLQPDNSSDTLTFSLTVAKAGQAPQNDLVIFCVALVMRASSFDMQQEGWAEIDAIMMNGGTVVINGWEYSALYDEQSDPMVFRFSARKIPAQPGG